jgi:hypothetical protein
MHAPFLELMTRSRAESVRDALQAWRGEARRAPNAQDRQDAIRTCLELAQDLRDLIQREVREVGGQPAQAVPVLQERRQALEDLCEMVLTDLSTLRAFLTSWGQTGESTAEITRLERAAEEVREVRDHLLRQWPTRSPAEMVEVRRQIERGEGVDAEVAFARIAGVDVETWRQRVEEHRRRKS